jgi:hypothetical protein
MFAPFNNARVFKTVVPFNAFLGEVPRTLFTIDFLEIPTTKGNLNAEK